MARILKIENVRRLLDNLQRRKAKVLRDRGSVVVSYSQYYAVYVHENLTAYHKPPTQAKFLEQPARRLGSGGELSRVVLKVMKAGSTFLQGLYMAGLRLQRESQLVVPVDTSALKNSANTRVDR